MEKRKLLCVEDNIASRKIIRDLFGKKGYVVVEAVDGDEAVAMAERERPDIILMDIQLPKISGYDAARAIKSNPALSHIPIIAVTSYALSGDDQKAYEAGCDGYMAKPFRPSELSQMVERFVVLNS
jgi:two-component system cell cycle response regulator DivK